MNLRSIDVDVLDLTVRAYNCLAAARIKTVRQLVRKTPRELLRLPNMGKTTVRDVERALEKRGLWLNMRPSEIAAMEAAPSEPTTDQANGRNGATESGQGVVDVMLTDVHELDLSVRAYNCLTKANISTVCDLVAKTPTELLQIAGMGRTTLRDIERAVDDLGLQLGDQAVEITANSRPSQNVSVQDVDAFVRAVESIKRCGVDSLEDLVCREREELVAMPGMDERSLDLVEDRLRKWGIELGVGTAGGTSELRIERKVVTATDGRDKEDTVPAETARDELISAVRRLLSQTKPQWERCFLAFYGVAGTPCLTLQELADRGVEYGFGRPVTRERIRQVVVKAERRLRKRVGYVHIEFGHWETAVAKARGCLPTSIQSLLLDFGYDRVADLRRTYRAFAKCAEILGLEFPFREKALAGVGTLVVAPSDVREVKKIDRLKEVASGPYSELTEVAGKLDCNLDLLRRVIDASNGWEFLDKSRRYFWKQPKLPPKSHSKTGNAILSSLCKIFSVTHRAATSDLVQSVARDRMVRKSDTPRDIPFQVLEGIAERSGLFELRDGQVVRKRGLQWCSIGERDIALLKICMERGRTAASNVLYSGLVQGGMTAENAAATVVHSPFLVHTRSGLGHKEGVYKLVPRPEDIILDALAHTEGNGRIGEASNTIDAPGVSLRITISSRTRLSGRYVDAKPIGMDGKWEVYGRDGRKAGSISIADRIVDGLQPVIDVLGLKKDDVLELRSSGDRQALVASL